ERLKSGAALRIARMDQTPIPGFEEDDYVAATNFNARSLESLLDEFIAVRKSTIALYQSLTEEERMRRGTASNKTVSSRVLFAFVAGHLAHHIKILKERYQV
ncbi:MAG TPA: DinB family protein, partial [Saprospiraceae bacterium]|nr:DinB family protein [Saprospiraceae bacterium]